MRPLRLELKNFTAYREPQVLDFDDLDLFAVTGPTGSGKSSLLDAMTYALYGKTPRVGNRTVLLIAQGQPSLSVRFDFGIDGRRFRVVRTTGHRAASATIRLEEWRVGEWESYGDGADRIRDATRLIEKLVGLDYEAFTRSVLLPQGQFQEFLVGDPAERRSILTELLGLELFERMARRAGEVAREARSAAEAKQEVLARQYAGVDEAAAKEARKRAKQAKARSEAMAEVERSLQGLAKESEGLARRIEALDEVADDAREAAEVAGSAAAELEGMLAAIEQAATTAAAAQARAADAEAASAQAAGALAEAEAAWGSLESLATLRASLEQFAGLEGRIDAAKQALTKGRATVQARDATLEAVRRESAEAAAAMERAAQVLKETDAEHEQAFRHDLVGTLTRGKRVGDPCPVCDRPLEEVRKVDSRELTRVKKVLDQAKEAARQAEARWSRADRDVSLAERDVQIAHGEVDRTEREIDGLETERARSLPVLQAAFGGELPARPVDEIDVRLADIRARRVRVEEAGSAARLAREESMGSREASKDLAAKATAAAGALRGLPIPGLLKRARQSAPGLEAPGALVAPIPGDPGGALEAARGLAGGLSDLVELLAGAVREARSGMEAILLRAREHLPEAMPAALVSDLDDLLEAARTSAKDLVAEAAEAKKDAERLAHQVKERKELEQEVRARSAEAAVFQALAGELRADRLITFLQGEALELLAAAGSERLLFLSQGRYRLAFEGDEFYVEDRQNGDERRSVRTLSGGETFLASLALALALSEQIQSLAVTQRARLQSLFIDEGFGALDLESLEIATEALSQLGGHDRMVGVITHVSELAERLPVRVEVRKLPSGSRLEVVL